MKKLHSIAWFSIISLMFTGCATVDKGKHITTLRDELDKAEQWRYTLPIENSSPEMPRFPAVKTKKLSNGLTLMVVEDNRLPIVSLNLVTKNGSARDPHGQAGLMNLMGEMLKEGTKNRTSMELAEDFANLGTEVSVSVNKDMTTISTGILSDKVEKVIGLLADMVKSPRMDEGDFERIKLQQQSYLTAQQGVLSHVANTNFLMAAYGPKHPYAYPSAGTIETITKLTIKDVKHSHRHNFAPNVAAVVAVGDVSLEQIEALAIKHFGKWHHKASSLTAIKNPPVHKHMQTRLIGRSFSSQTYLLLGQPAVKQKDHDLAALEVLSSIMTRSPMSRLGEKLREEKGWTYGVHSFMHPRLGEGPFLIGSSIQTPFGADALNEILREFDVLRKEPVTAEELTIAKNGLLNSFSSRFSTVTKVADGLAKQFTYSLPAKHFENLYRQISAVTAKDVTKAANRVLKKETTTAVAVGDLEALEASITKMDVGTVTIEREGEMKK